MVPTLKKEVLNFLKHAGCRLIVSNVFRKNTVHHLSNHFKRIFEFESILD